MKIDEQATPYPARRRTRILPAFAYGNDNICKASLGRATVPVILSLRLFNL